MNDFRVLCKVLRCPNCNDKRLILIKNYYFCDICHSKFRIKNEIINFLPKQLTKASQIQSRYFSNEVKYTKIYSKNIFFQSRAFLSVKENIIPSIKGKNPKILEIGCGPFAFSRYYKNINNKCEIFVCDLNETILQASKYYDDYGKIDHRFILDALNLPFKDNTFDYVVGISFLHHISHIENAMKEVLRVTKKGGYYLGILEPFGPKLSGKIRSSLIPWLRNEQFEFVRPYDFYSDLFMKNVKKCNLKIIKGVKYQRSSAKIMYFYYLFQKLLPSAIIKQLGGNLMISLQK